MNYIYSGKGGEKKPAHPPLSDWPTYIKNMKNVVISRKLLPLFSEEEEVHGGEKKNK